MPQELSVLKLKAAQVRCDPTCRKFITPSCKNVFQGGLLYPAEADVFGFDYRVIRACLLAPEALFNGGLCWYLNYTSWHSIVLLQDALLEQRDAEGVQKQNTIYCKYRESYKSVKFVKSRFISGLFCEL